MSQISFHFEDIAVFSIAKNTCVENIITLNRIEGKSTGSINIIFCSDEYLLKLNKQYLKHNYYTDIITFDYVDGKIVSGDLFISTERVRENTAKYNVTFNIELARVIFHGVLHLNGYKDNTKEEKKQMREKETFYLEYFDIM